ncbi:peroxin [Allomyces arbusculus]|nr:peroxin [Allomyces arbusculus]
MSSFIRRHRSKVLWLGGISAAAWLLGKYAKKRIIEMTEQASKDRAAQENLRRRFEQNQQDCTFTVLSMLPILSESLFHDRTAELLVAALQRQKTAAGADPGAPAPPLADAATNKFAALSKQEIWNELKIVNFTQLLTALYSVTLLTAMTRVQLNLVGRLIYLDSVLFNPARPEDIALQGSTDKFLPHQTEHRFLTFSWYFLHVGWKQCADRVRNAVESVLGSVPLKKSITAAELNNYLAEIRVRVESDDFTDVRAKPFPFQKYLLPIEDDELTTLEQGGATVDHTVGTSGRVTDPVLRRLLDECRDIFDAPDFARVVQSALDSVFGIATAHLTADMPVPPSIVEVDSEVPTGVPMATLLPKAKQLVHGVINGVPNEYIAALSRHAPLQQFATLIYAQFSDHCVE